MNISEYFNEDDDDHLKAYEYLMHNGTWPEYFLKEDIIYNSTWIFDITAKLANKYIAQQKTENKIICELCILLGVSKKNNTLNDILQKVKVVSSFYSNIIINIKDFEEMYLGMAGSCSCKYSSPNKSTGICKCCNKIVII